jgi:hypothetical protein
VRAVPVPAADLPHARPPVAFRDGGDGDVNRWRRDDGDDAAVPAGVSVSFCPKNFTTADPDELEFGPDNTLDLDDLNAELAEANARFLDERMGIDERTGGSGPTPDGLAARGPARVPLKQLRQDLL